MNIYLAAPFSAKHAMRLCRKDLALLGHNVTSRWILSSGDGMRKTEVLNDPVRARRGALTDIEDIDAADLVAIHTADPSTSGGLHWEFGYSFAKKKDIAIIGPPVNVFFALPNIMQFDYWADFLNYLR